MGNKVHRQIILAGGDLFEWDNFFLDNYKFEIKYVSICPLRFELNNYRFTSLSYSFLDQPRVLFKHLFDDIKAIIFTIKGFYTKEEFDYFNRLQNEETLKNLPILVCVVNLDSDKTLDYLKTELKLGRDNVSYINIPSLTKENMELIIEWLNKETY